MHKLNTKLLLAIIALLIISQAGLVLLFSKSTTNNFTAASPRKKQKENVSAEKLPSHYSYFSREKFFSDAYIQGENQKKIPEKKIYAGIIPHHLIVKDKIAAFFQGIERYDYETIILIGPNHFSAGKSKIILSEANWETPYGTLIPNLKLINRISELKNAGIEEEPFAKEHSISGLVSFIKKSFPKAKFVPIILNQNTNSKDCEILGEKIFAYSNMEKTLVLASVDFSHYQTVPVADFHDLKSNAVIKNFDYERIFNLEIDSPASIYSVLKYLDLAGAKKSDIIFSTNSGELINQPDEPTTSHNFFYFNKGKKEKTSALNFLFFGDMMLDRNVGKRIKKDGVKKILTDLAGEENRFFQGIDLIGANLEGAVTNKGAHYKPNLTYDFAFNPKHIKELKKYNFNFFNLANNHFSDQGKKGVAETKENLKKLDIAYSGGIDGQIDEDSATVIEIAGQKIGLAGFSMVYSKLDKEKLSSKINEMASSTDFLIVNIHWGYEYAHNYCQKQQKIAHLLIDNGADMIIGHHPHVVQGMELYKEKPIFYSLGNFIFDQYFSKPTQEGLAIGINIENKKMDIFLFPFKSAYSIIKLMKQAEKEKFFQDFIEWSPLLSENEKEQIVSGRISF